MSDPKRRFGLCCGGLDRPTPRGRRAACRFWPRRPSPTRGSRCVGEKTYGRALAWPRLVLPEHARVRPLAHARSGVALRSVVKSSEATSGGRDDDARVDLPRRCFAVQMLRQHDPAWRLKHRVFFTSEALPTRLHGASAPLPRASETYLTASTARFVVELQLPRHHRVPAR